MGQKGFSLQIIILIVSLFVIVAFGIFYLGKNAQKQTSTNKLPVASPSSEVPKPNPETVLVNETAEWEVYKNTKFNYSLKYPHIFSVQQLPGEQPTYQEWQNSDGIAFDTYNTQNLPKTLNPRDAFIIRINGNPQTPDNKPFSCTNNDECHKELLNHYNIVINQTENITRTILGKPVEGIVQLKYIKSGYDGQKQTQREEYFVISNNKQFFVINIDSFYDGTDFDYINPIYNTILASLEFTN